MPERWKAKASAICLSLLSFAAGSLLTARLLRTEPVSAAGNGVFELMVYHTLPGKAPTLESIFRDVSQLQARHGLAVVGYWVPTGDPAFPANRAQAALLIEKADNDYKVDEVFMRPTDFSALK